MATVFDVAAYILEKKGEMTAWKLQKLIYYSQAWVPGVGSAPPLCRAYRSLGERYGAPTNKIKELVKVLTPNLPRKSDWEEHEKTKRRG